MKRKNRKINKTVKIGGDSEVPKDAFGNIHETKGRFDYQIDPEQILKDLETGKHLLNCIEKDIPWLPQYFSKRVLKDIIRKNWEVDNEQGGLVFINEELIREQRKLFPTLIKSVLKQVLQGVSIFCISVPIKIFDCQSFLQKVAFINSFAPVFFNRASKISDKKEQFKLVITNMIPTISLFPMGQIKKPFNPILGETFQGHYSGDPIYIEQISHNPPLTQFLIYGKHYKMEGMFHPDPNLELNAVLIKNLGKGTIYFENTNNKIEHMALTLRMQGIMTGKTVINIAQFSMIWSKETEQIAVVWFGKEEGLMKDHLKGAIYKASKEQIQEFIDTEMFKCRNEAKIKEYFKQFKKVNDIEGYWTHYIKFDDVKYWEFDKVKPYQLYQGYRCLPSDSCFRKDMLHWMQNKFEEGQKAKQDLEEIQRNDRKLRKKYQKKLKKSKK